MVSTRSATSGAQVRADRAVRGKKGSPPAPSLQNADRDDDKDDVSGGLFDHLGTAGGGSERSTEKSGTIISKQVRADRTVRGRKRFQESPPQDAADVRGGGFVVGGGGDGRSKKSEEKNESETIRSAQVRGKRRSPEAPSSSEGADVREGFDVGGVEKTKKKKVKGKSMRAPKAWEDTWKLMVELRAERNAPVDSMGAEMVGAQGPFHTLVALMLSSQTKDQVVAATMETLRARKLSLEMIEEISEEELDGMIGKVGFHKRKAGYIKQAAKIIRDKHSGNVPDTLEGLVGLPGVGPKMAFLVLNIAFKNPLAGIGVDTHMHRICAQIGWTNGAKNPEDTRKQLESWLPKEHWQDINLIMVGLGQMIQQPVYREKLVSFVSTWTDTSKTKSAQAFLKKLGLKQKPYQPSLQK